MRFLARSLTLLGLALVCAAVSNALAKPERKLRWFPSVASTAPGAAKAAPAAATAPLPVPASSAAPVAAGATAFAPHPDKPWIEISGEEAAALQERGNIPVLDARRSSVYREGHVAGARPFSVWEADIDEKVQGFFGEGHDPNAPILVYCSGGDCEDSHMLGQKLYFVGFDNVLVYKDGFPDWQKRGLAVAKGDAP